MRSLDLSPLFRSTVGFDRLDKLFDAAFREASRDLQSRALLNAGLKSFQNITAAPPGRHVPGLAQIPIRYRPGRLPRIQSES